MASPVSGALGTTASMMLPEDGPLTAVILTNPVLLALAVMTPVATATVAIVLLEEIQRTLPLKGEDDCGPRIEAAFTVRFWVCPVGTVGFAALMTSRRGPCWA